MLDIDKLSKLLAAFLTRWFIRLARRSKPEETRELTYLDEPVTVYTFQSDTAFLAQTTVFGTIIWNKQWMDQLSESARKLVLRHELSHRDRNDVFKGMFLGMVFVFAGGALIFIYALLAFLLGASLTELTGPIGVAVTMMAIFTILFRFEETLADYHALCELGEQEFLNAYDEVFNVRPGSTFSRAMRRLFYTDPAHTVRLYRFKQKIPLA